MPKPKPKPKASSKASSKATSKPTSKPKSKSKPKQKPKPKSQALARTAHTRAEPANPSVPMTPTQTQAYRELFWQNVLREVIVALIVSQAQAQAHAEAQRASLQASGVSSAPVPPTPALDGRLGLITTQGQRIPIARIDPVFASSTWQQGQGRQLSELLQCTVFQVRTPGGEVYTLPLHEIRGFHALSEELMAQLEAAAASDRAAPSSEETTAEPFGFAAFTSTARSKLAGLGEDALGAEGDDADEEDPAASGAD